MPIIKSAKKRVRIANKAAIRNSKTKRSLKAAIKAFTAAITGGTKDVAAKKSEAQSAIDTAAKKGVMHKNKAARKQAQLARAAKVAATVEAPKKAAAKKPAAAKKTVAKKAPAKKPATKKTAEK
jgi:small subunit ribosomal protein S20